jgi:isoquinoline 1-oxidoreductase beta subunit
MTHHDAGLTRPAALEGFAELVIGFHLPRPARGQSDSGVAAGSSAFAPNAFIHIGTDDLVTVLVKYIEFGQGPFTGLATLVAEELDADWAQMRAKHALSNPALSGIGFGLGPDARTGTVFPGAANDNRRRA